MTTSALRSLGTAAASQGQEAAATAISDEIVEDKTLEKVRAWQVINKVGLLVGRNHDKMIALMVLKNQKQTPKENPEGCSRQSSTIQRT